MDVSTPVQILIFPDARLELRVARLDDVIDLRHVVLRQGLLREAAIFDQDHSPSARHYAAFERGRAVCCATFHLNSWEDEPAWQLRGMATDARFRGRGVGKALMELAETDLLAVSPVRRLWCNGRLPAASFYLSQGWEVRSGVFDIPTAGPHYKMTKRLSTPAE